MKAAIKVHDEIFKTMGAKKENIFHHEVEDFSGAGHIMGTYRMGDNPSTSVVDKYQRSHDNKNLFLVGSGVFPTVGASNPTFTIGALSLWASQTIIKQLDNN
jgi:choline dehydrogenase-like flavoprotein